jgi:P-type Ca2+ transporter type 2C
MLAGVYLGTTWLDMPQADVRELVFLSLIISIVVLILANRSFDTSLLHAFTRRNIMLRLVLGAVAAVMVLTVLVPQFRALLKFGKPDWPSVGVALGLGALLLALLEGLKLLAKRQVVWGLAQ